MAMFVTRGGGKANKNGSRKNRTRRMKGGNSHLPLSPYTLAAGDNLGPVPQANANFTQSPLTVPSSTMVGGGYGYGMDAASISQVPSFAGSYFPVSRVCTAGTPDNNSRGGNNFGQGGGSGLPNPLAPAALSGGGRKKRKGGSSKRKGGTMKKWRQRGCNRKGGSKKKSKGKRRH